MLVRIEFLADRIDFGDIRFFERGGKLFQRQFDAALHALDGGGFDGQRGFKAVLDGQQFAGEIFDRVLVGVGDVGIARLRMFSVSALARSQAS